MPTAGKRAATNLTDSAPHLRLDGSWQRLLGGSGRVLALKLAGAFGGFLFSLLVARQFGDDALGRAELFVLAITVGGTLLRGGVEGAAVKLFSGWAAKGEHTRLFHRFIRWSRPMVAVAVCAGLIGWCAPMHLRVIRFDAALGLAVGAWVLIGWSGEALRGVGRVGVYALLQPGWWMLMALVPIVLLGWHPIAALSLTGAVLAVFGMGAAVWFFRRAAFPLSQSATASVRAPERASDDDRRKQDGVQLRTLAGPIWLGSMLHLVLSWADTALIAAWLTEADVAHYRAAFRLAALLTFTQFAVNALGAPTFGALHAEGDREGLRRVVHRIGWMNTAVALPGAVFLAVLGHWLLGFWGPEFTGDAVCKALLILAAGQAVNALCGPVMYLLNMTGGERAGLAILAISALVQLGGAAWWVPQMGIVGAAVSATVGMCCWNALGVGYIRYRHGFVMVSLFNGWWRHT